MSEYIESFNIPGVKNFGIEDRYAEHDPSKPAWPRVDDQKRYQVWAGGCGIGTASSLEEAREMIHGYAMKQISADLTTHRQKIDQLEWTANSLGVDPFYLGRFLLPATQPVDEEDD